MKVNANISFKTKTNHPTLTHIHINNHTTYNLIDSISYKEMLMWNFSCWILTNWSSLKGFVKISASWISVETSSNIMSSFWIRSLKKWYLISICLVLECWMGFFDRFITLVLSHMIGIWSRSLFDPYGFCITTTGSNIFSLSGWKSNQIFFLTKLKDKWVT